jgi:GNAT superfamily N-acetyltransferase
LAELAYRIATVGDAADIFAVLQEVAVEIPVVLDTLEREEAMYARVRNWARSGESWVAVDGERIVGFVLAELNQVSRFWAEHEVIDVRYAGVAESHRDRGIFGELMRQILNRAVPVMVTVNPANRSAIACHLEPLGFRRASPGDQQFLWEPGGGAA